MTKVSTDEERRVLHGALGLDIDVDRPDQRHAKRGRQRLVLPLFRTHVALGPARGEAPPEVGHAPGRFEAAVVRDALVRRAEEARMRPGRRQPYAGLVAARHELQVRRAFQIEREREGQRLALRGQACDRGANARREQPVRSDARTRRDITPAQAQRDPSRDAARVRDPDVDRRALPVDCRRRRPNSREVGSGKPSAHRQVSGVDDHLEQTPPACFGIDGPLDRQRFRQHEQAIGPLLHDAVGIPPGVPVWNREHRAAECLRAAPLAADRARRFVSP